MATAGPKPAPEEPDKEKTQPSRQEPRARMLEEQLKRLKQAIDEHFRQLDEMERRRNPP